MFRWSQQRPTTGDFMLPSQSLSFLSVFVFLSFPHSFPFLSYYVFSISAYVYCPCLSPPPSYYLYVYLVTYYKFHFNLNKTCYTELWTTFWSKKIVIMLIHPWGISILRCIGPIAGWATWATFSRWHLQMQFPNWQRVSIGWSRDPFVYAPSQWETTLQCNVVSHWQGAYTK